MNNIVCDRYKICPGEVRTLIEAYGKGDKALEGAITYAQEFVRIYAMPARWEASWLPNGGILVKRFRNRTKKIDVQVKHFGDTNVLPKNDSLGQ